MYHYCITTITFKHFYDICAPWTLTGYALGAELSVLAVLYNSSLANSETNQLN
jgi:hypothetical protein